MGLLLPHATTLGATHLAVPLPAGVAIEVVISFLGHRAFKLRFGSVGPVELKVLIGRREYAAVE